MTPQRIVPLVRTPEPPRLQAIPGFHGDGGIRTHGLALTFVPDTRAT